jgi:hypothetical protein
MISINNTKFANIICLLIGVTYNNTNYTLPGCDQDVERFKSFLNNIGVSNEKMIIMTENQLNELIPTKSNIETKLNEIVIWSQQQTSDNLIFIYYSGHGTMISDISSDEKDGKDECICPSDFFSSGVITDDYIKLQFINRLSSRSFVFSFMDACYSGTIFDLKYTYESRTSKVKNTTYTLPINKNNITNLNDSSQCTVINISGSRDSQQSIIIYINNKPQSLLTYAFLSASKRTNVLFDIVNNMQKLIGTSYNNIQTTTISSNKNLDLTKIKLFTNLTNEFLPKIKVNNKPKLNRRYRFKTKITKNQLKVNQLKVVPNKNKPIKSKPIKSCSK